MDGNSTPPTREPLVLSGTREAQNALEPGDERDFFTVAIVPAGVSEEVTLLLRSAVDLRLTVWDSEGLEHTSDQPGGADETVTFKSPTSNITVLIQGSPDSPLPRPGFAQHTFGVVQP